MVNDIPQTAGGPENPLQPPSKADFSSKKIAAGICGILIGGLGIHKFILGLNTAGIIMILVTIVGGLLTCGTSSAVMGVIGLVEGIIYLTKPDDDFYQAYAIDQKQWF